MRVTQVFREFFESERAGGIVLIFCTIFSLIMANSGLHGFYESIWHFRIAGHPFEHWINDGLMTIFFVLVGLELEREFYAGELSSIQKALLPLAGAIGGMLVPAGIYMFFNHGTPAQSGAGIPMATDIAFALGILSLLGKRVPLSLKVFLTALAVMDDLGAILVIALFYTKTLAWTNLILSIGIWLGLLILNRLKVHSLLPYLIGGVLMWYFMLNSGVHATITGVLFAFALPFGSGDKKTASYRLQHFLHKPVPFIILPLFALANTAIVISDNWVQNLTETYSLGIALGLVLGKPAGITAVSFLAVFAGICKMPAGLKWKHLFGAGILGGIGFTMSIFITLLAFDNVDIISNAKFMILIASTIAGILGYAWLHVTLPGEKARAL